MVWLVAGLGNPGKKYERTRHNIGFLVADELADRHHLGPMKAKFGGETASGVVRGETTLLVKPMEFMNHSGFSVQRFAQYRDVEPDHVVVAHDDIDLDFGRVKVKAGGGHGGHNGLRSIVQQLGSREFARVRIGVGKPGGAAGGAAGYRDRRVAGYVLSEFPSALARQVEDVVHAAADAVELVITAGVAAAMNEFNGRVVVDDAS